MAKNEPTKYTEPLEVYTSRLLTALAGHIGRSRAIGMGELYQAVTGMSWDNRISDTRFLRRLITDLRESAVPICSSSSNHGGGYYLASAGSELTAYLESLRAAALKKLSIVATLKRTSLPELMGQMSLEMAPLSHSPLEGGQGGVL